MAYYIVQWDDSTTLIVHEDNELLLRGFLQGPFPTLEDAQDADWDAVEWEENFAATQIHLVSERE